ncbi:hypothetical protein E5Q_02558 [Mixia osmundae IAM 14324]|uniref:Uncharacterized protein n=1 Tax=Mixia osmundae (strain CBS 9802 / IAM 14324 / JCM 22182 / KY 12970) TaxID=764103 RepID=G7DZ90_MIXOS|nr:hypothetical protein E5Q_02558 [Mixia osmundae IAM 14324]
MTATVFAAASGITAILNIVPFLWHLQNSNSGPICLGFWIILMNFLYFINALVWANDALNRAPAFCDITAKLQLAGPIGVLVADLCILRFLAQIVSPKCRMITAQSRRRASIYDYCFSLGLPVLVMATHIIYQPYRFGLAKNFGCLTTLVLTWPTYILFLIWPPILSFVACVYAVYIAARLIKHRRAFGKTIQQSGSAITPSRFVRLGLLSTCFVLFNLPLSIYNILIVQESSGGYIDYSWDFIHADMKYIQFYPLNPPTTTIGNWSLVIAGLLVFLFFGFGSESMSYYRAVYYRTASLLRLRRHAVKPSGADPAQVHLRRDVSNVSHSGEWKRPIEDLVSPSKSDSRPFQGLQEVKLPASQNACNATDRKSALYTQCNA